MKASFTHEHCDNEIERLHARIRSLEESLAKYQACRVHDVDEKAWLSKRVTELEAALDVAKRQPYLGIATNREIEAERACRRAMGHSDPEYRTWQGERSDIDDTSKLSLRTPSETPEAMHGRIVTETADALAQEHFKGDKVPLTAPETELGTPRGEAADRAGPLVSPPSALEAGAAPTLICPMCGVDRYKRECPNGSALCPVHGESLALNRQGKA